MTCSALPTSVLAKAARLFLILYEGMTLSTYLSLADECLRARNLRQLILDACHIVDAARPLACVPELLSGVCATSVAQSLRTLYYTNPAVTYTWKTLHVCLAPWSLPVIVWNSAPCGLVPQLASSFSTSFLILISNWSWFHPFQSAAAESISLMENDKWKN